MVENIPKGPPDTEHSVKGHSRVENVPKGPPDTGHSAKGHSRDIADVPAVEVVSTAALHLMSAAAVQLGLAEDLPEHHDLDEARSLIEALAGLVTAATPRLGHHHAAPLRDGLKSLQLVFRECSEIQDAPGDGPGEKLTGPVYGRSVRTQPDEGAAPPSGISDRPDAASTP